MFTGIGYNLQKIIFNPAINNFYIKIISILVKYDNMKKTILNLESKNMYALIYLIFCVRYL